MKKISPKHYYPPKLNPTIMAKFDAIKNKYLALGVTEDNIDFAIGAVQDGSKREHIIEILTADYRGMTQSQSTAMLEEMFAANGGEFKKENSGGYLYGILFLLLGIASTVVLVMQLQEAYLQVKLLFLSIAGVLFGFIMGASYIIKAIRGKFRDEHERMLTE